MAGAARSWSATWIRPEVIPIFVCIAGACGLSAFQIVRCAVASPDVRVKKSERAMGVLEDKHFYKEGASFREHGLRSFLRTQDREIFASLNARLGGAQTK